MVATDILTPADEAEAAETIRQAASGSTTLEITGGGTKRGIGQPFVADRQLSASALTGITEYNPGELVVTARAGTPVFEIEAALLANNQMLTFEPGDWRDLFGADGVPTIGTVAAANISGPRRIVTGAARDSLLGVRFINGAGEIIKNGGKVMKNVTGLDLVKLMAGSWGTLGLLTEVSFKVLPRVETQSTLAIHGTSAKDASAHMAAAMATSAEVSGAAHIPENVAGRILAGELAGRSITALRLEGFAESVKVRLERVRAALPAGLETSVLDEPRSSKLWRELSDVSPFAASDAPLWKISTAPMAGHAVASHILHETDGEVFFDWQGGLLWLQVADRIDAGAAAVRAAIAANSGGHATLIRAPEDVRRSVPVFQPLAPGVAALSERVRASMDPAGIFNPGRMVFDGGRKAA